MIPGFIIAIITFPGVIIHEAAHMLFCKLRRVAVLEVCFFRFENPCGYVLHEKIDNFNTAFLVSVGPFIINSVLCILICFPAFFPVRFFGVNSLLSYFILWLGLSIGMHAFPSNQDANVLYHHAKREIATLNPLAIISFPLVALIYLANILSMIWFDLIYGVAIGLGLPALIF
jgi:hypothetical protein